MNLKYLTKVPSIYLKGGGGCGFFCKLIFCQQECWREKYVSDMYRKKDTLFSPSRLTWKRSKRFELNKIVPLIITLNASGIQLSTEIIWQQIIIMVSTLKDNITKGTSIYLEGGWVGALCQANLLPLLPQRHLPSSAGAFPSVRLMCYHNATYRLQRVT